MEIVSYIKDSFQEYEGQHSLVLFSKGCNFRCSYCYNYEEVTKPEKVEDAIEIMQKELNPLHDAVVFLGGEPTIWGNDLISAITFARLLGLKTKLYTNGSHPEVIRELIKREVLDAISIDLKTVEEDFTKVIRGNMLPFQYLNRFEESVFAVKGKIPVEVRTTIYDGLNVDKVKEYMEYYFPEISHILTEDFRKNL